VALTGAALAPSPGFAAPTLALCRCAPAAAGEAHSAAGNYPEAIAAFDEAVEVSAKRWGDKSPRAAMLRVQLAEALLAHGQRGRAREEASNALEIAVKTQSSEAQRARLEKVLAAAGMS
jgi:tetratricopeptide (TPR) repeat protein